MKILLILNEFGFNDGPMVALDYAKFLRRNGHDVFALAPQGGDLTGAFQSIGCKCIADPNILGDSRAAYNLAQQVDQVVCFSTLTLNTIFGAKGAGKPTVLFIQEPSEFASSVVRDNYIFRRAVNLADMVVFSSEFTKSKFFPYIKDSSKVRVVKTGTDEIDRSTIATEDSDKFRVLMLGNIEPRKNQLAVIQALKDHKDTELTIVGKVQHPAYGNQVITAAKDAGNVKILTPLSEKETLKLLRNSEVYLIAGNEEAHTSGIPEALALGTPVCVSAVGALPEFISDKVGVSFNINTIAQLDSYLKVASGKKVQDCIDYAKENFKSSEQERVYQEIQDLLFPQDKYNINI